MSQIHNNVLEAIGDTPLVDVSSFVGGGARVLAKMEGANPLGSVKDRIGLAMIDQAEKDGLLAPGGLIVEPTSGNTGIGLAMVAATRGYRCLLVMPESMSIERRKVMLALGAELLLTPAEGGMVGSIDEAHRIATETPGAFMPNQFSNPANPDVHRRTTGPEIWADTDGCVDVFVAGVGTGGTLTGCGEMLKAKNPNLYVVAIEPSDSPVLSQRLAGEELHPGPHKIQGIGAGFIPEALNVDIIDEVALVDNDDAMDFARRAASEAGLFVGISSGAALKACSELSARQEMAGKTIVTVLPSYGERYLSSELFAKLA